MLTLAANVVRENLRNKVLYVLAGIGFLFMMVLLGNNGGKMTDQAGNNLLATVEGTMRAGFAIIGVLGALVTVVLSMNTLPREFERQTIHLVLVRPVERWQIAGSFLVGNILTAWIFLLVLAVPLLGGLSTRGALHLAPQLLLTLPALALNTAMIAALTTLASAWMPGPAAAFAGLIIYGFAAFGGTLSTVAALSRNGLAKLAVALLPPTDGVALEALKLFGSGGEIDGRVFVAGLFYLWAVAGLTAASLYKREV